MTTRLRSLSSDFAETKRKVYRSLFGQDIYVYKMPSITSLLMGQDTLFLNTYNVYGSRQKKDKDGYRDHFSSFEKSTEKLEHL